MRNEAFLQLILTKPLQNSSRGAIKHQLKDFVFRSSHQKFSVKTDVLKNFANFTGKHMCQSLFIVSLKACNFIKKKLQHKCFPIIIANLLRAPILKNICKQLLLCILWIFKILPWTVHFSAWWTPMNHKQSIFIIYYSAGRERTKQFSATIKIN